MRRYIDAPVHGRTRLLLCVRIRKEASVVFCAAAVLQYSSGGKVVQSTQKNMLHRNEG